MRLRLNVISGYKVTKSHESREDKFQNKGYFVASSVCLVFFIIIFLFSNLILIPDSCAQRNDLWKAGEYVLLPHPRSIIYNEGNFVLKNGGFIWLDNVQSEDIFIAGKVIKESFKQIEIDLELTASRGIDSSLISVKVYLDQERVQQEQGYQLIIASNGISIIAHDPEGAFYAAQTLKQICRQTNAQKGLSCLTITDWPDFLHRGVLLDISRDKVPTMETLFDLVDMLAEWKINQLQLYMEHAYAYQNHRIVWENSSPMTGEDILLLDRYCKDRFVKLVPCQNSFGHMARWFEHEKYQPLAELDLGDGFKTGGRGHYSLSPAVPEAIEFVSGLFDELLPNFSSSMINVCADETSDLCEGKSAELCKEYGKGRVYLDFLLKIYEQVQKHGTTMQFWCDILVNHPELVKELPENIISLVWGYAYDDKRLDYAAAFDSLEIPFYMCPGTCTWRSVTGRTENMLFNHRKAATLGLKHKALGYLNTDWGDMGHWQPLPVSYPGYAYGAAVGWAVEQNLDIDLPAVLNKHAFFDENEIMGKLVCDLGNTYVKAVTPSNDPDRSKYRLFHSLIFPELLLPSENTEGIMTVETLENTIKYVDNTVIPLNKSQMNRPDSQQIIAELENAGALLKHICHLGIARLQAEDQKIENLPEYTRGKLSMELEQIINEHKKLWVVRNRIGGLDDSVEWVMNAMRMYEIK